MVQTSTNHTDQLPTGVKDLRPHALVIVLVPLLHAEAHLCSIVGCQGDAPEMTASSDHSGGDEILKGQGGHVPSQHTTGLGSGVNL